MTRYEWKMREDDGAVVRWRAERHGARWSVSVLQPGENAVWERMAAPPRAVLEDLREMLFRKYQRRRIPWEYLPEIDAWLGECDERESEK